MRANFTFGKYEVSLEGEATEDSPIKIMGVSSTSAVAAIERMCIDSVFKGTNVEWFLVKSEHLCVDKKHIAKLTVGAKGFDQTRDFYFDISDSFDSTT
jgi:hypothetical protein